MAQAGLELLNAIRVNRIMAALADVRETPQDLVWLGRTQQVDADDDEITAHWQGRVQIADIITDDAQAVTYTSGKITYTTNQVPNIKHGAQATQSMIRQWAALQRGGGDIGLYSDMENRIIANLLLGIRQRQEALIVSMLLDSFSYDRMGVKMTGVSWGTPSDLKVTPTYAWTDATNATPVNDVLTLQRLALVRYGVQLNRLTMSLSAFMYMIATTEFQNKARMYLAPNVSFVNVATTNTNAMISLAQTVMGVNIEIYEGRYWSQDETGALAMAAFQPINKVLFTSTAFDNRADVWDWASGVTVESMLSGAAGGVMGRLPAGTRGPIAYATVPTDLNPPQIEYWAVARGFPRKHLVQANAVLTVGSFTDTIPVGPPF